MIRDEYFLELTDCRMKWGYIIDLLRCKCNGLLLKLVDLVKFLTFLELLSNLTWIIPLDWVLFSIVGINMKTVSFAFILVSFMYIGNLVQWELLELSFISLVLVSIDNKFVGLWQNLQSFTSGACNGIFYINIMHVF